MDGTIAESAGTSEDLSRRADDTSPAHGITASTFRTLSFAIEALEGHRDHMERSRAVLTQARALCDRLAAQTDAVRSPVVPLADAPPAAQVACGRVGCGGPALFRPCFVVELGGRTLRVDAVPLALCAAHRDLLAVEFATPRVLDALRGKLRARRGVEEDADVRVWFQTLQ